MVEANINISFPTPSGIQLSGRITRVDLIQGGYRGVLLGSFTGDWANELRFPLLQAAIARHYAIPVAHTHVGVQNVDGSGLAYQSFDRSERDDALARLDVLARALGL